MRLQRRKLSIEQKNLEFLIRAFKLTLEKKSDLKLVLVGDGNYKSHLVDLVKELDIQSHVDFQGYQTNINPYLETTDIFVNPSYFEGMPNTVLEAMAKGVYVLCSNIPEHQFLIQNGITGTLFNFQDYLDFRNKIIDFYDNPNHYAELAKSAQEYVSTNHSFEIISQKLLTMYTIIMKTPKNKMK